MRWAYVVFGLHVHSDTEIPGLDNDLSSAPADVLIRTGLPPRDPDSTRTCWYRSPSVNRHGRPNLIIWRRDPAGAFHFAYDDNTEFLIAADGGRIWCQWSDGATDEDAAIYLRGPILAMALRLRGVVSLHASTIVADGLAVALAGAPRAGKSTAAAGFAMLGFRVLTDDVSVLRCVDGRIRVMPGPRRLGLWPDAADALFGRPLPRLAPAGGNNDWWDKRYIDLEPAGPDGPAAPAPLSAIYVLAPRAADARAVQIGPLGPKQAFMALVEQTYVNYALDRRMRAEEFRTLGEIVRTIPVRQAVPPDDHTRTLEFCRALLADHAALIRS